MEALVLIGRILFALIFIGSGLAGHLMATADTAGYAQMRGMKNAATLVRISGVLIAAAGIGIVLGIYLDLAALGAAAFALIASFMIHHFWTDEDEMTKNMEMALFMKNLSIAGGGLVMFALAATGTDMGWTLTDPLFDL